MIARTAPINTPTELRTILHQAAEQRVIEPEDRFYELLSEPFDGLGLTQRWSLMQDLLVAERQNHHNTGCNRETLNSSNFAVMDYCAARAVASGQPQQQERIDDFLQLVAHGSGGGCSADESKEGLDHMYGALANDKPARERFKTLAVALENARAAKYAETMISGPYEDTVAALARVQGAENRLGDLQYENRPSWRTIAHFTNMVKGQTKGISIQQSAQWIERFIDSGLKSIKAVPFEGKGIYTGTRDAYEALLDKPAAAPFLDRVLDVEESIAAPIIPGERAVHVAALVATEEDVARALHTYSLIAPAVTSREGFDKTLEAFGWLKSHDNYTARFMEGYAMGQKTTPLIERFKLEDLHQTVNAPAPSGVQHTDGGDLMIGGVRVPVRR